MAKIKFVYDRQFPSFQAAWMLRFMQEYFDFEPWDRNKQYEPGTLFYMDCMDLSPFSPALSVTPEQLANMGFRVIVDNLWEVSSGPVEHAFVLTCPAWFWYGESLNYSYHGYNQHIPRPCYQKLALMPMRIRKTHRNDFVYQVEPLLEQMIWSYVAQGRQLPNDVDLLGLNGQRHFDPDWYNLTYLSMVVESSVDLGTVHTPVFVTEKTFKPMAFRHPFIVYGQKHTLRFLKDLGFVTFDHLWNENYDNITNTIYRRDAVVQTLKSVQVTPYDSETLARLEHNHQLFFDTELVKKRIIQEIVEPMINYAQTR